LAQNLRTPDGHVQLVHASGLHRFDDEESARRLVTHALGSDSTRDLWRLAEDLWGTAVTSDDQATELLTRALVSGRLVLVRLDREDQLLDEPPATMLSDLIEPEPVGPPERPTREPELTWVSFEIVDESGERLDVSFSASVDGQDKSGRTEGDKVRFTEVELGSSMTLEFSEVLLPVRPVAPIEPLDPARSTGELPHGPGEPPQPGDTPPSAPHVAQDQISVEVVDDAGRPVAARVLLLQGDAALADAQTDGRVVARASKGSSVELRIEGATPQPRRA
jgi:hypothetical protein